MTRFPRRALITGKIKGNGTRIGGGLVGAGFVCCAAASYEGGGSVGVCAYLVSAMACT